MGLEFLSFMSDPFLSALAPGRVRRHPVQMELREDTGGGGSFVSSSLCHRDSLRAVLEV